MTTRFKPDDTLKRRNCPIVARLDREKLTERMRDLAGMSQQQADEAIDGISVALETWFESIANSLPLGTRAEATITGLGKLVFTYQRDRPLSSWRRKHNIPQTPAYLIAVFEPIRAIHKLIKATNRQIRAEYFSRSRPARAELKAKQQQVKWVQVASV